jgi:uncharacterized membrane protein YhaH (DUF805 family)
MTGRDGMSQEGEPDQHVAFAIVFGIVGAMALSKFIDPSSYVIGPGTLAAGALGVTWPVLAVCRRRWDTGTRSTANARLLLWTAYAATSASLLAALIAFAFVIQQGFTIDLSAASAGPRAARGAWMLWLFPMLALVLTSVSVLVGAQDVRLVRRHLSNVGQAEQA